jgi:hypothetical protein
MIKSAVRTRFMLTGRNQASNQIRKSLERYLVLARSIDPKAGALAVRVPSMLGVDEDMREWSFFMILEHNVIVNRSISTVVQRLARGEKWSGPRDFDPKRDVMPSANPGEEQIQAFLASVETHLEKVARLPRLRSTPTSPHPIFGELNAHGWHCMFGLHLELHRKQAEAVRSLI